MASRTKNRAFTPFLRQKGNKANQQALKKQKDFPELECVRALYEPHPPTPEGVDPSTLPEPKEILSVGVKYRVFATHLKDPHTNEQLFNIHGAEHGSLFLCKSEIENHFDTSPVKRWFDAPWATTNFKLEDVKYDI